MVTPVSSAGCLPETNCPSATCCGADDSSFEDVLQQTSGAPHTSPTAAENTLRRGFKSAFMDGAGADGVITLDEIKAFHDRHAALAKDILRGTLAALRIAPSCRLQVDRDTAGNIFVNGSLDAASRAQLEAALNSNDEFVQHFGAASSSGALLECANRSLEFQEAYRNDPEAAVTRFAWLFGADWRCWLTYEAGEAEFVADRVR